ncbi:MAG: hypothetical protein CVU46_14205 [Chloroflexi bacterium HGW-Chloroflexi-8]|jgi:hypothetical protein|nr:MAG: hypothetical protein CVU46_14205 [Chloroflexi bacterium HGW-Chloroflexi-8]
MVDRIIRAIKLDKTLFAEAAKNESLLSESLIVVVLAAVLTGIGSMINADQPILALISEIANSVIFGWLLWSVIAYFVGTFFFGGKSTINEMLRTIGFANAPRLLSLFAFIPCVGWLFVLLGGVLSLIAGVIAIRESMEFNNDKALITAIIGFILFLMSSAVLRVLFAGLSLPFQSLFN